MERRQVRNIKYINKQHRGLERNYKKVLVDSVHHISMISNTLYNMDVGQIIRFIFYFLITLSFNFKLEYFIDNSAMYY